MTAREIGGDVGRKVFLGKSIRNADEDSIGNSAFGVAEGRHAGDLPDFFGPFQSWRTASVASVEQYRC
ncbi:hypothetical protein, partial [Burkholderia pseudomallei]